MCVLLRRSPSMVHISINKYIFEVKILCGPLRAAFIFNCRKTRKMRGKYDSGGYSMAMAIAPTIQKPGNSKSGHFCSDFKRFLTKWRPQFQIPFKIQTICNPTPFDHSKSRLVQISDPHCTLLFTCCVKAGILGGTLDI